MKTNKKGISLIVLTITIIVMIILATAIVLSISGRNVIGTAKETTASSDFANAKHVVSVAIAEWEMDEAEGYSSLKAYAEAKLVEAGFRISGNGGLQVSEEGGLITIYVDSEGRQAFIPNGYVASGAKGENTISGGLVIYEGTEPVTDKNVKDARKERNQYVWVPVDSIDAFYRRNWAKGLQTSITKSYKEESIEETVAYHAMYNSVKEYKGFYIARYEAGKESADTLVSKKNVTAWHTITWTDAKAKCEEITSDSIAGHLIYGEEWDLALLFMREVDTTYPKDSTGKGNYTGSRMQTGSSDAYALKNIYDMAGNYFEWTMEIYPNTGRVLRGGVYTQSATSYPAARRSYNSINKEYSTYSFRVALYLK